MLIQSENSFTTVANFDETMTPRPAKLTNDSIWA